MTTWRSRVVVAVLALAAGGIVGVWVASPFAGWAGAGAYLGAGTVVGVLLYSAADAVAGRRRQRVPT